MNAVHRLTWLDPIVRVPSERVAPQRLVLAPIAWGTRDRKLAKVVCAHVIDATPPMVVPFQPLTHRRTRAFLRSHGVHC
jgi:hypothetical protein